MKIKLIFWVFLLFVNSLFSKNLINTELLHHAENCPQVLKKDLNKLVAYLKKPTKDQSEAVEVFFYWITKNVAYDVKGLADGSYLTQESKPLETGVAVCQGYADLLKDMCVVAKIDCYVIVGYAKERFANTRANYKDTNHAWNMVKVDGVYKIVDATWGSGYVRDDIFYAELEISNLYAEPNYLLEKRLPSDPRWQLKDYPISLGAFAKYDSVQTMLSKATIYYNYKDSIQVFENLDSNHQAIATAMSAYRFNPTIPLVQELANTYYRAAYDHSKEGCSPNELNIAIVYYKKAIDWYNELEDEEKKKEHKKSCYRGIAFAQYLLK